MKTICISLILVHACAWCSADESMTIVTYNIHHGEGTDAQLDLDRIASIVRALEPDVVCLQEVDQGLPRTQGLDMPALFAQKLDMQVVFGHNYAFDGGLYGNATLTRLPVVNSGNTRLPGPAGLEPRGCLRVTVRSGKHVVDVLNTHLGLRPDERLEQAAKILEMVADRPAVLAGDLNAQFNDPPLTLLQSIFRDTVLESSAAATFPGDGAGHRIDYILITPPLKPLNARVVDDATSRSASDHLPYVARIDLGPEPESLLDHGVPSNEDARLDDVLLKENH